MPRVYIPLQIREYQYPPPPKPKERVSPQTVAHAYSSATD